MQWQERTIVITSLETWWYSLQKMQTKATTRQKEVIMTRVMAFMSHHCFYEYVRACLSNMMGLKSFKMIYRHYIATRQMVICQFLYAYVFTLLSGPKLDVMTGIMVPNLLKWVKTLFTCMQCASFNYIRSYSECPRDSNIANKMNILVEYATRTESLLLAVHTPPLCWRRTCHMASQRFENSWRLIN